MLNLIEIKVKYTSLSNILAPKIPATNFFFKILLGIMLLPNNLKRFMKLNIYFIFTLLKIHLSTFPCYKFCPRMAFKATNVIKKRLQHRCFSVSIAKFSRAPILKNICKWLLLSFSFLLTEM